MTFDSYAPLDNGPTMKISKEIWSTKYAAHENETHSEAMTRIAQGLSDNPAHYEALVDILSKMRFLPAGRIQAGAGSGKKVTMMNCFVSGVIEDSMQSIMLRATEAAETMRMGGGIGYDFSNIRPRGDLIKSMNSRASGPVSFMGIFDAICKTVASAGHRRGAQMATLLVSHPDIEEFIDAKRDNNTLTAFNISVAVTDDFMNAVQLDTDFDLTFEGKVYKTVKARALWDKIMLSTWDWAEPGVIFIDRMNKENNVSYVQKIISTNPCSEIPLQAYGACLLGSFNLVKYVQRNAKTFDFSSLVEDIPHVVRMMDNVNDRTVYPLPEQRLEAMKFRRIGIGVTGMANALELLGCPYGSYAYLSLQSRILETIMIHSYLASVELAKEKGSFPLLDKDKFLASPFVSKLPECVKERIKEHGIRNSHLLSLAPTGTISITADNVSSGIEPVFSHSYNRTIQTFDGPIVEAVEDYAFHYYNVKGKTADECSVMDHVRVAAYAQQYVDQSISKTCNVGDDVTFEKFKDVYLYAYKMGCKGVTTFRNAGKRYGVLTKPATTEPTSDDEIDKGPTACYINPTTGKKECE